MSDQEEKGPTRYRTDDGSGVYYSCIEVDDMIAKLRTQVKATRYARDGYRGEVYKLTHDLAAKGARIKELEQELFWAVKAKRDLQFQQDAAPAVNAYLREKLEEGQDARGEG
jgi:hypothetical protein